MSTLLKREQEQEGKKQKKKGKLEREGSAMRIERIKNDRHLQSIT